MVDGQNIQIENVPTADFKFIITISFADSFGLGVLQAVLALCSCCLVLVPSWIVLSSFVVDVITDQETKRVLSFCFCKLFGSDSNEVVYIYLNR